MLLSFYLFYTKSGNIILHKNMQTDIIYLDFAKAFDSADHNIFLAKLRAYSAMV